MGIEPIPATEAEKKTLIDYKENVKIGLEMFEKSLNNVQKSDFVIMDFLEKAKKEINDYSSLPLISSKVNFGKNLQKIVEYGLEDDFISLYKNVLENKSYGSMRGDAIYYSITEEIVENHQNKLQEKRIDLLQDIRNSEEKEELPDLDKFYEIPKSEDK